MEKYGMAMAAWEAFGRPLMEENNHNQATESKKKPKQGGMMMA